MTSTDTRVRTRTEPTATRARDPLYASLVGLAALAVWLQGLWAGLFIREGKDFDAGSTQASFVEVHDWGARIAIVLALAAFVVAAWRHRTRKDLVIGTGAFLFLLMLEAYIGGEIGARPSWPSLHVPLAMALMGLAVWLPLKAMRPTASSSGR